QYLKLSEKVLLFSKKLALVDNLGYIRIRSAILILIIFYLPGFNPLSARPGGSMKKNGGLAITILL
ncbi:MAG: hypothetical protein KAT34_18570, partial [Candidatus Aminicenantes bacterium]|nr:hypothetical protein [Candidatus Aminicenantes bacterium]